MGSKESKLSSVSIKQDVSHVDFSNLSNHLLQSICGCFDEHLNYLERQCSVRIHRKGSIFFIQGPTHKADLVSHCLQTLAQKAVYQEIDLQLIQDLFFNQKATSSSKITNVCVPRHASQQEYLEKIQANTITFGLGPAGTGKTYLAVAEAVTAYQTGLVNKLILTRPAVEAGEHLGYLPGDLQQKIDPYLRPLFDALNELMGQETVAKLLAIQTIEVAPLAFMRGRTLSKAFVLLDEAQNTTPSQMKLFLTRLGAGSKMVITGDITQVDLPKDSHSGLYYVYKLFNDIPGIAFHFFEKKDVVRHPLVTRIIEAYEQENN